MHDDETQQRAPLIVVGCQKGGIGRTVVAVNLAAMLAIAGRRTLLVDLDPKGDATAGVGLQRATGRKREDVLREPWSFLREVQVAPRPAGLDVWPGGPAVDELSRGLDRRGDGDEALANALSLARQRYRAVVVDSPSDLGPLSCGALASADVLLIPLSASAFAERALGETLAAACRLNGTLRAFGVRLGVRDEDLMELDTPEAPTQGPLGIELLETAICADAATLDQSAARGLPVFEFAPGSRAARSFIELGREVVERILDAPRGEVARAHSDRP